MNDQSSAAANDFAEADRGRAAALAATSHRVDVRASHRPIGRLGLLSLALVAVGALALEYWFLTGAIWSGAALEPLASSRHAALPPSAHPLAVLIGINVVAFGLAGIVLGLVYRSLRGQIRLLTESRERNRAIVDNMVDGAIHIDAAGRIIALNRSAQAIFGYGRVELRGTPLSRLLADEDRSALASWFAEPASRHGPGPVYSPAELNGRRGDGETFPLYLAISRVDLGGYPLFTAIVRDMTETRRRMRELADARDQAMDADRAKSQFLAVMSHEIRTPMNGIIGMLDLLRDGNLTQQQLDFIDTAEKSSNTLLNLLNDILDLSKIEAGKLDLQEVDFDLRACVEEVTAVVASNARAKPLEVACFVNRTLPTQVRGDPYRVRQVLMNLMTNAVKFTQQGEVIVTVSAAADDAGRISVRGEVRDTGIGIAPDVCRTLFQPFTQADASTTRRFGGTGLGLVICKRLVNLMGGDIGVHSKPAEGSTFWFTLQVLHSDAKPQHWEADLHGVKSLIVDDNATNRLILENYLKNWGAETESVEDGVSALAALKQARNAGEPFLLAILDMQMPNMDGIELAQRIKGDGSLHETQLVMLSSLGYPGHEARRAGIEVSLLKPVRQVLLHDAVVKVLGRGATPAPASAGQQGRVYDHFDAKILVAEDNPVNQKVVLLMLRRLGLEADMVGDGAAAVAAVLDGRKRYDLVFMDLQMPIMGGYEATRQIRAAEAETGVPRTPIVAMTASALNQDRKQCVEAGMDDFVSKPVDKAQLDSTLKRWLTSKPDTPEPATAPADSFDARSAPRAL
jgi:PAS domain S-box-containing protein